MLDHLEETDSSLLEITADNASLNYSITGELQSTVETPGRELPSLMNQIPFMAQIIPLGVAAFIRSFLEKGRLRSSEAHEHNQQFGENESNNIWNSQTLRIEGNARINK